jgi:general secretion pathway protein B
MSYILDALRKAERERGIKQVPTLMTDHAPRDANSNRLWIGITIVVVCAVIVVGWYFIRKREPMVAVSKPGIEYSKATTGTEASSAEAPSTNGSVSTATHKADAPSEKSALAPKPSTANTSRNTPREQTLPPRPPIGIPDDEEAVNPEDMEAVPPHEAIERMPRPNIFPSAPEAAVTQPTSLKEAVGKMNLSLLMYSDNKAERMVYINGKKYGEGNYIEGTYLLESITPDGAIISNQGERTLLQPKSK